MKTTVDIADAVLDEAKRVAADEGTTLRALLEEGLRRALDARRKRAPFTMRDASFGGRGLQPGIAESDWSAIRERVYEGRGG